MLSGNKGEWSEVYVLLKLLADGEMLRGDGDLNPIPGDSYRVVRLERNETATGLTSYRIEGDRVIVSNERDHKTVTRDHCLRAAQALLQEILNRKGSFALPLTEAFLQDILAYSIKAKSIDKADIKVEIYDHRTAIEHTRGFSIKSQLGGASTLFNASGQTHFRYLLNGLQPNQIEEINAIAGHREQIRRVQAICRLSNVTVDAAGATSDSLLHNLMLMDDGLPGIVSSLLWLSYQHNVTRLSDLIPLLASRNPRGYRVADIAGLYAAKLKRLLVGAALGMKPSVVWDGNYDATGGYLVVLNSGEIVSYHIYDRKEFEEYLLNHTKLETPSTKRHGFGRIVCTSDCYHIDLSLQIRFL